MAELKTKENKVDVVTFINNVDNQQRREDGLELLQIFRDVTGLEPKMWGSSIIGFGKYHYKSERSRQEGDWPLVGFSPRKQQLSLYFMDGFDNYKSELEKLGKYKTSVSCLYVKKLSDIDKSVLKEMITKSYKNMKKTYKVI
ncbi:DUF1801 domain-containing protein [Candidatus Dojkabacteria bacterium]|jgi:hypothetical protein|uniref:DUF1801 domain-containing protein n=1 Tax=Candidatus Dojkabacteria bacterium TaxID=2099670 RepID=A0A955L0G6_9BACT|nr:DUF1801 domain-containing protein [Candidatus Dojkabacteria bacterium]